MTCVNPRRSANAVARTSTGSNLMATGGGVEDNHLVRGLSESAASLRGAWRKPNAFLGVVIGGRDGRSVPGPQVRARGPPAARHAQAILLGPVRAVGRGAPRIPPPPPADAVRAR